MTVQELLTRTFRLCGILGAGQILAADDAEDGLQTLNEMLSLWNTDGLNIFEIDHNIYDIVAQDGTNPEPTPFTIGPSATGTWGIVADRPQRIENANIVLSSNDPSPLIALTLLNAEDYAALKLYSTGSPIPDKMFCDYANPNARIYFWPYLNASVGLELFTWKLLDSALTLASNFVLPPGYNEAVRFNLALRLASEYGAPISPRIDDIARKSLASIQSANVRPKNMCIDPQLAGNTQGGEMSTWNYYTGTYN